MVFFRAYWPILTPLFLSLIGLSVGTIMTYIQMRSTNRIKKAEFTDQVTKRLRFDRDLAKISNEIIHNKVWDEIVVRNKCKLYVSGSEERLLFQKFLAYLSYICYLHKKNVINKQEMIFWEYQIKVVCTKTRSRNYLWNAFHLAIEHQTVSSFCYLMDYGIKRKFFPTEFKTGKSIQGLFEPMGRLKEIRKDKITR